MLFWKKNKAHEIINDLKKIGRITRLLIKFEGKKDRTHILIQNIKANIIIAEEDILKRAEEEKDKSWIDVSYDDTIDNLALQEITALKKLDRDINDYEEFLIQHVHDEKGLNEVIVALIEEENTISKREAENKKNLCKNGRRNN